MKKVHQVNTETPLYRKNPETTQLGQRILSAATELYAKYGLEWMTFRKLAVEIDSTEASIYRYFHNKYQLLAYLLYRLWRELGQELERWNRELSPSLRRSQLLVTLFPGKGEAVYKSYQRSLMPVFWSWYMSRTEQDEAYSELALDAYLYVVDQATQALEEPQRPELAHMLCQTAGTVSMFENLPGFDVSAYRLLWENLLRTGLGAESAPSLHPLNLEALVLRRPDYALRPETRLERLVHQLQNQPEPDDEYADDFEADLEQKLAQPAKPEPVAAPEPVTSSITHVMVKKRGGYNLLELQDFMILPPAEQQQLLLERRIHFISGEGQTIEMIAAIRQLFPAGLSLA